MTTICNLVGLKERLEELRGGGLDLETPLFWELPPFFRDEVLKSELERLVHNKSSGWNIALTLLCSVALLLYCSIALLQVLLYY